MHTDKALCLTVFSGTTLAASVTVQMGSTATAPFPGVDTMPTGSDTLD